MRIAARGAVDAGAEQGFPEHAFTLPPTLFETMGFVHWKFSHLTTAKYLIDVSAGMVSTVIDPAKP